MTTSIARDLLTETNPCFADSRRLMGHNRFFAGTGAVLETLGPTAQDGAAHERWRTSVDALRAALGWAESTTIVRRHAGGTLLAIAAPADLLFTGTEINEWAWEQASGIFANDADKVNDPAFDQLHPLGADFAAVVEAFRARTAVEFNPRLAALQAAARQHHVPLFVDDQDVSIGAGTGSRTWPLIAMPDADKVDWNKLHDIPVALVTGSNGKTTTVRLLAALIAAAGATVPDERKRVGYSSTEGVMIGGEPAGDGDFSGPAGARLVLRDARVDAAVLETARGGILRRGLAVDRADVAIVTNISADHFGEYGIDSLEDLADVKLVTAHALARSNNETPGTLVLNADDPVLLARASTQTCRVALFAIDDAHPALVSHRDTGGATCGLADGNLWLCDRGTRTLLGALRDMPLTLNGAASFNIANIAAAALAASAMSVAPETIALELKRFGGSRQDNPGRLDRWQLADITVLIDYAHNPGGLAMLLAVGDSIRLAQVERGGVDGRIGLLLGQAGNRRNEAIDELARTAASFKPQVIVLKEIATMLRGRAPGEVTALLRDALLAAGYPPAGIREVADEVDASRHVLHWARAGDVVVLPIHQTASRSELAALFDQLEQGHWLAGTILPTRVPAPCLAGPVATTSNETTATAMQ